MSSVRWGEREMRVCGKLCACVWGVCICVCVYVPGILNVTTGGQPSGIVPFHLDLPLCPSSPRPLYPYPPPPPTPLASHIRLFSSAGSKVAPEYQNTVQAHYV
jgi:hypothetical protein